jgi:hypothetical protein
VRKEKGRGIYGQTDLEKECTGKACANEEKVWRIWYMADGMHRVHPYFEQRKGSVHALRAEDQKRDDMLALDNGQYAPY